MSRVFGMCSWCGEAGIEITAGGVCDDCRPTTSLAEVRDYDQHRRTARGRTADGYCHKCKHWAPLTFWTWSKDLDARVGFCEAHGGKQWSTGTVDFGSEHPSRILGNHRGTKVKPLPMTAKDTGHVDELPSGPVRSRGRVGKSKALRMRGLRAR